MVDKNSIFGGMITTLGAAKKTNCDALGVPWEPRYMLIGDANGADPVPSPTQSKLINQVYRAQLNQLRVSPTDANVLIAEVVLPPDVGGWHIRELALEDKDGVFSAVANVPPSYKPLLAQGSGRNQVVRMHIITSGTSNIQLKIDPSVVLATRQYVDEAVNGLLPANKPAGTYTKVTFNDRGIFVSGSNPTTLAGYGITDTYTKEQITAMIAQASALPVGSVIAFPVNKVPPGFLEIDNSVKSAATYPDLAAFFDGAFNRGDEGAGNFRMPESRGEFLRGWDHGRGVDVGRAIGSWAPGQVEEHDHAARNGLGISGSGSTALVPFSNGTIGNPMPTGAVAKYGGSETRPRSIAVMWCIKAWNAPINQGNIDIAALSSEVQTLRKLVVSGYKGLSVSATGTNALIAIKARRLVVGDGATAQKLSNVDLSINLAVAGLGGLDSGAAAASNWYGAWVVTDGAQTAAIAALMPVVTCSTTAGSAVVPGIPNTASMRAGMQFGGANFPPGAFIKSVDSPTQITASVPATVTGANASLRFVYEPLIPVGYVAVRVGAFLTDATANKFPLSFQQFGRRGGVRIAPGSNVAGFTKLANGSTAGALVPVSVLGSVPPTAISVSILVGTTSGVSASTSVFANASSTAVDALGGVASYTNNNTSIVFGSDILLESGYLHYTSNSPAAFFSVTGWEDDL